MAYNTHQEYGNRSLIINFLKTRLHAQLTPNDMNRLNSLKILTSPAGALGIHIIFSLPCNIIHNRDTIILNAISGLLSSHPLLGFNSPLSPPPPAVIHKQINNLTYWVDTSTTNANNNVVAQQLRSIEVSQNEFNQIKLVAKQETSAYWKKFALYGTLTTITFAIGFFSYRKYQQYSQSTPASNSNNNTLKNTPPPQNLSPK